MHISFKLRTTYKRPRLLFYHQNPGCSVVERSGGYLDHLRNEILVKVLFSCIPGSHLIMPAIVFLWNNCIYIQQQGTCSGAD